MPLAPTEADAQPWTQAVLAAGRPVDPGPRSAFWRWMRADFPWLASPMRLLAAAALVLALGLGAEQGVRLLSHPPPQPLPMAQQQLRLLLDAVDEGRGAESLLVMLPPGAEREAALSRLQRQQRLIEGWLRDNGAWLAVSHGAPALSELRASTTAWLGLQRRIVQADDAETRTGLPRASRALTSGPSADAYRRIVAQLEGMAHRRPD